LLLHKIQTELDSLIGKGITNNKGLKAYQLQVDKYQANIKLPIPLIKPIFIIITINNLASNNKQLKILIATTLFFSNSLWSTEKC
jgi:cobalt-zinc-cadmium resistance protein CzcA